MKSSVTKALSGLFIGLLLGAPALANPVPVETVPVETETAVEKRQFLEQFIITVITQSGKAVWNGLLGPDQP
jgi:hypothetical protein